MGIDLYIFGYRLISCDEPMLPRLVNAFLNIGINARHIGGCTYAIRESDFKSFRAYAGGRVRYTASEPEGAPRLLSYLKENIHTVIALLFGIFLSLFLSRVVWDVRVTGNERLGTDEIVGMLEDVGVGVGSFWAITDTERAEADLLLMSEELAWVQINRRGTVLYVEVREREGGKDGISAPTYASSNIVASRSGVIEEITVKSGFAVVKAGDVVKEGDLLIMGVQSGVGGSEFVRAEGRVIARSVGEISATANRKEEKESLGEQRQTSLTLRLFGLSLNIFKNYGNSPDRCVIIDDEEDCLLLGKYKLPISLRREYALEILNEQVTHTDSELPELASARLTERIGELLGESDLIKIRTEGEYTDDGYVLRADYVYSAEIGREVEIDLSGLGEIYGKNSVDTVG